MKRHLHPAGNVFGDGLFFHASTGCSAMDVDCHSFGDIMPAASGIDRCRPMEMNRQGAEPEIRHGGPADVLLCSEQMGIGLPRAEWMGRKFASPAHDMAGCESVARRSEGILLAGCRHD